MVQLVQSDRDTTHAAHASYACPVRRNPIGMIASAQGNALEANIANLRGDAMKSVHHKRIGLILIVLISCAIVVLVKPWESIQNALVVVLVFAGAMVMEKISPQ